MQTFECHHCEPTSRLFFDNTLCLGCQSEVGWCPRCHSIEAMLPEGDDQYRCANSDCGAVLKKCHNYAVEAVCNRMLPPEEHAEYGGLCDCCRHNSVIPDLSIEGHRERWAALEAAKRRLFYTLDLIGLPHPAPQDNSAALPLAFSFMADALPDNGLWRATGNRQKVYTGHANGLITINLMETDDVERERLRVDLNEAQRTLIGHFRHEIGHYYWELLVRGRPEEEQGSREMFGDHDNPTYSEALERYYAQGPAVDWNESYISAYATMHPWEDFAETFAAYQDTVAVLDTGSHLGMWRARHNGTIEGMLKAYQQVGMALNELNREMGLMDVVPEVITPAILDKLRWVHELVGRHATPPTAQEVAAA
ncbi:zinc-binding metallopeptidase family protein [Kushneria aurantia]|uniref:Zinc-binding metallopeptidase n=1 Tax=Kushneria aurantia TaxID=504092 RepID=A0ABV6FYT8_9GAMM|nr:putative zinc-binding metallopeptidase [Kushneria aurantia]